MDFNRNKSNKHNIKTEKKTNAALATTKILYYAEPLLLQFEWIYLCSSVVNNKKLFNVFYRRYKPDILPDQSSDRHNQCS